MTIDLNECLNGCETQAGPVYTEGRAQICPRCERRLANWLRTLPENYAMLWMFIDHGTVDKNPESKTTKRSEAAAPMRLEVIDLLDTRLGRRWNGTAPANDRRGVIGTLRVHVERLIEDKPLTATKWNDRSVAEACNLLYRHRLWLAEQDWITYLYDDLSTVQRAVADGIGDFRRPPVGRCHVVPEDAEKQCGGPLFADDAGGVHCAKCRATWDSEHLAHLGLAQAKKQQEEDGKWLTDRDLEQQTGIKAGTVRVWANRGEIARKRDAGRTLYEVEEVRKRAGLAS